MGASGIEVSGENDLRKHLLAECYDNYYPLAPADRAEYERLAAERLAKGRGIMNGMELRELRGERRGEARGLQLGRLNAKRESLVKLLMKKFGLLPDAAIDKLESLTPEQLDDLLLALLDASSIAELGLIEPS